MNKVKICPRCANTLQCNASDIVHCDCQKVKLAPSTLEYLSKTNYDCLCNRCLIELNDLIVQSQNIPFPQSENEFIEGIHFYKEGLYFVFTELYHIQRGYCCHNGCRHCAYGKAK